MRISNQKRLGFEILENRTVPTTNFVATQLKQELVDQVKIGDRGQEMIKIEVAATDKVMEEIAFTANGNLSTFSTGYTLANVDGNKTATVHGTLDGNRLTFDIDPKIMKSGTFAVSPDLIVGLPGLSCQMFYGGMLVINQTTGLSVDTYPEAEILYNRDFAPTFTVVAAPHEVAMLRVDSAEILVGAMPSEVTMNFTSTGGYTVIRELGFVASANVTQVQVDLGATTLYSFPFAAANGTQVIWMRNLDFVVPAGEEGRELTFIVSYATENHIAAPSPLTLAYVRYFTSTGVWTLGTSVA